MPSHGLKSDSRHPYQKQKFPFWRYTPKGMYSEETKEMLELRKIDFDSKAKYINWTQK